MSVMEENFVQYCKALSNPVRLKVFLHVARESEGFVPENPKKESCVTEISKALNIPQPTVSNHLSVLKKVGLVKSINSDTHCFQYVTKHAAQDLLKQSQYIFEQAHKNPY